MGERCQERLPWEAIDTKPLIQCCLSVQLTAISAAFLWWMPLVIPLLGNWEMVGERRVQGWEIQSRREGDDRHKWLDDPNRTRPLRITNMRSDQRPVALVSGFETSPHALQFVAIASLYIDCRFSPSRTRRKHR